MVPTMPAAMAAQTQGYGGGQQMAFPGMAPFDPSDPASMMVAMQAMANAMAEFSARMGISYVPPPNMNNAPRAGRCHDYDTKGFCAKGSACPYEHGEDRIVVPTEPTVGGNPFAMMSQFAVPQHNASNNRREKKRATARNMEKQRGRKVKNDKRSEFSAFGSPQDPSVTTVVVERIPQEYINEKAIREAFSPFGDIENLQLLPKRRVALVRYAEHDFARKAIQSRQAFFNDRYVRTFWHKSSEFEMADALPQNGDMEEEEEVIDPVELQRRIDEAQKAHEEKLKRIEEAKAQREELDKKISAHAAERKKLRQALREKERLRNGGDDVGSSGDSELDDDDFELRNKLAALEAEAELLGLDPNDPHMGAPYAGYRGRGRGGYRGRGRGARGAFRGQYARGGARSGVLRLDNRTKSITINIAPGTEEDEKMRQLVLVCFSLSLSPFHPPSFPGRKD